MDQKIEIKSYQRRRRTPAARRCSLSLTVDMDMFERLDQVGATTGRTTSDLIRECIRRSLDAIAAEAPSAADE